jgi:hypothetical protein
MGAKAAISSFDCPLVSPETALANLRSARNTSKLRHASHPYDCELQHNILSIERGADFWYPRHLPALSYRVHSHPRTSQ